MKKETLGMWLGVLGVATFAVTLPLTRLATGTPHPLNAPFDLDRFRRGETIDEAAAGPMVNVRKDGDAAGAPERARRAGRPHGGARGPGAAACTGDP